MLFSKTFKILLFFTSCLIWALGTLSCKQEAVLPPGPSVSFSSGLGVTDMDGIRSPGENIYVKFIANRAGTQLEAVRVYLNGRLFPEYGSSGFKRVPPTARNIFRDSLTLRLPDSLGLQKIMIEAIDLDGKKGFATLNITTQDPVEVLDTIVLYSRFNTTDTFSGFRRGQYIELATMRVFDSAAAVNNPFLPDLGFEVFTGGLARIFSPEAAANLTGAIAVPGGRPVFIDSVNASIWQLPPRGISNLSTPIAQSRLLALDSVYYFTDRRRVRGLIKVSELVQSPASSGRILAFLRLQAIPR